MWKRAGAGRRWRWPPRRRVRSAAGRRAPRPVGAGPQSTGPAASRPTGDRRRVAAATRASMVPAAEFTLLLRPADPQGAGLEARHRRRTCSPAGWPPASALLAAGGRPDRPAGAAPRRPARPRSARVGASAVLPGPRPGPAGAVPPHAAGGQADLADVGGHLDPRRVRRRRPASPRSPRPRRCCRARGLLGLARRALPPVGHVAGLAAAATAPALATYTAVLLADTAVPSWHEAYPELPFVFAGSALASGAGVGPARRAGRAQAGPARRLAVAGAALELVGAHRVETRLGLLSEPYRTGPAGRLLRAGRALTAAGVAGALLGRRSRVGLGAVRGRAAGGVGGDPVRHLRGGVASATRPEVHGGAAARAAGAAVSARRA